MAKTNNRIDEFVEQMSFRLAGPVQTKNPAESRSTIETSSLNAFRPSGNKRALKGLREKKPGNLKKANSNHKGATL